MTALGSAGNPPFYFSSDSNTGMWSKNPTYWITAMDIGNFGSVNSWDTAGTSNGITEVVNNLYYDGTNWRYKSESGL